MLKVATFLKRDAGMSLDDFRDYHEECHSRIHGGLLEYSTYCQRHYLRPAPYPLDGVLADPAYDVLTEIWFANRQRYEEGLARLLAHRIPFLSGSQPGTLDDSASRMAMVEEHQSHLSNRASSQLQSLKLYALLKRKPGMSLDDFIAYYETYHARLGERFVTTMSSYRRLFLRPVAVPLDRPGAEAAYDVVTELCFPDESALEAAAAAFSTPEILKTIAEDEAKFVEPISRRLVSVESF